MVYFFIAVNISFLTAIKFIILRFTLSLPSEEFELSESDLSSGKIL